MVEITLIQNRLAIGETLRFGNVRTAPVLERGWSNPERDFCWTDDVLAEIRFTLPPVYRPLTLTIDCEPKIRESETTEVLFCINGELVDQRSMSNRASVDLPVKANTTILNLFILVPSAVTAANLLAQPPDYRHLGLCVHAASLRDSQLGP